MAILIVNAVVLCGYGIIAKDINILNAGLIE